METVKIIDATPTWQGILKYYLAVLQDGNAEGRKAAITELQRMAKAADDYNDLIKNEQKEKGFKVMDVTIEQLDSLTIKYLQSQEPTWQDSKLNEDIYNIEDFSNDDEVLPIVRAELDALSARLKDYGADYIRLILAV